LILETSTARTYAALSATNEAILYAKSPEEMYQQVCEAALSAGNCLATAIFLRAARTDMLRFATGAGKAALRLRAVQISIAEAAPHSLGLAGEAFRDQRPCISNDFLNDERSGPFREGAREAHIGAIAALPLTCDGQSVGVLMIYFQQVGSFSDQIVALFERMAANISFSLSNFEREGRRQRSELARERNARMFAALSATNEAIFRAQTSDDMFRMACAAAVEHGMLLGAAIFTLEKDSPWFKLAAGIGVFPEIIAQLRFSSDPSIPEGQGLGSEAFRTGKPCISNDVPNDPRSRPWLPLVRDSGLTACAVFPLFTGGVGVGVMFFFFGNGISQLDDETITLMGKLSENVSFGLEIFDREARRRAVEERKESLSRMFAALNATNEAIMRAKSRAELFELVCEAAVVGGDFTSAVIALAVPGAEFLDKVASAGRSRERAKSVQLSVIASKPEGQGITGIAFRTRKPCITNDYLADFGTAENFRDAIRDSGTQSGAAFPLLKDGSAIGVLVFLSSELAAFDPTLIALLQRLADNISFALENFDRADEKIKSDKQKDRLTRMFEALSATNEAIMRAKSRAELFELVCEAAVLGGIFTSTTIVLAVPNEEFFQIAASRGRNHERVRSTRFAISADHPEGRGLTGTAFRTKAPCIMNDFLSNQKTAHWHALASEGGTRSGASFPLLKSNGAAIGVLLFLASEQDVFTADLVELLAKIAENISFALDNFDRADEKTRADERIEYLASHDSLTNLPNREMFNQLLHLAIQAARRYQRQFAVLFIDLDRFKIINDSLGHEAGDLLLAETAERLCRSLRSTDVVARLGGDEFVVILENTTERHDIETMAHTLLTALSQPLQLSGHECNTTASIGIAMFPNDGSDVHTLTKNADMAMYLVKEDGKNAFRFYTRDVKMQSIERLRLESCLRHALERNQFTLHYQPKVDLVTGQITGVEALLRWTHPELGVLPPAQFIPLAEETGLIVPIGRWVLREACAQNMAWRRRGLLPVSMAVNLSPRQFVDENLLNDIDEALVASGMPSQLLQLEVTESMVMRNVPRAIRVLDAIQSRGIRLAIDDFGTGYSSMSLMKQFPIDTIKIDRSFVRDLPDDSEDKAIAQAIISMGKALGMTVVAEGVETTEQETFLRDHACDEMQGFLFSKPLPPKQLADLLRPTPLLIISPPLQPARYTDSGKSRMQRRLEKAAN
jgi:diguanylate cyclase (GGDEF)-like protein